MKFAVPHLLDGARWNGMRIGILGGSYNPPHHGHVHISLEAMRALQLDFVWWLVTPQNPLKDASILKPYNERIQLCREITADHPRILVTDLENHMNSRCSYDTVLSLRKHFTATNFVFITGMDNALTFHTWNRWRDVLGLVATAHIARPPAWSLIRECPLRLVSGQKHVHIEASRRAELTPGFTYWLLRNRMIDISSTQIRNRSKSIS